jgi:uncharacterized membrane protein YGL010W
MEEGKQIPESDGIARTHRNEKRWILIGLLVSGAIFGAVFPFLPESQQELFSAANLSISVAFFLAFLAWCYYDASDLSFSLSKLTILSLLLVAPVGFPVYLFRTRGARRGLKALALTCLFLGVWYLVTVIAVLIASLVGYSLGIITSPQ